jgi:hypothetical protein
MSDFQRSVKALHRPSSLRGYVFLLPNVAPVNNLFRVGDSRPDDRVAAVPTCSSPVVFGLPVHAGAIRTPRHRATRCSCALPRLLRHD